MPDTPHKRSQHATFAYGLPLTDHLHQARPGRLQEDALVVEDLKPAEQVSHQSMSGGNGGVHGCLGQ